MTSACDVQKTAVANCFAVLCQLRSILVFRRGKKKLKNRERCLQFGAYNFGTEANICTLYYGCLKVCLRVTNLGLMPSSTKLSNAACVIHPSLEIDELIVTADKRLFGHISMNTHCLHHLLPPQRNVRTASSLRTRGHNFTLPHTDFSLYKNSFINRCLFQF